MSAMRAYKSAGLVNKLRELMKGKGIDAFVVPTPDPHNSEYVAPYFERRAYISGFTGSFGTAVITADQAVLWTDSRYTVQAKDQLESEVWGLKEYPVDQSMEDWLASTLPKDSKVGYDAWITTHDSYSRMEKKVSPGLQLVSVDNLVDEIWDNETDPERKRTPMPSNPVVAHPVEFSGQHHSEKLKAVGGWLLEKGYDRHVVSALDEVAWLLNLRGSDIPYNPVFFSYCIVDSKSKAWLCVDESKVDQSIRDHLGEDVTLLPYNGMEEFLKAESKCPPVISYCACRATTSQRAWDALEGNATAKVEEVEDSYIVNAKSIKNQVELEGMRQSHRRDGIAVVRYLHWLDTQIGAGADLNEVTAADQLEAYRKELDLFKGLSFNTISAVGPNAAMPHYDPAIGSKRKLSKEEIYLCDSGAQFSDGTTDITRTVHFGTPKPKEIEAFTRVLKGHIAMDNAVFPSGTLGNQIDTFARMYLWEVGWNFGHGTGHGVGSFLNVHEGPQRIGPPVYPAGRVSAPLKAGMVVSDEPGFYEAGEFGIRIENLVLIVPVETKYQAKLGAKDVDSLTFEAVTLVPLQRKLIDLSLLSEKEVKWVNDYHAKCMQFVHPLVLKVDADAAKWMEEACAPLA